MKEYFSSQPSFTHDDALRYRAKPRRKRMMKTKHR